MFTLRGWVAQHIERSLAEALVWLESTQVRDKNVDKSHNRFCYEQEKLTIKLDKPGVIQLIGSGEERNSAQFMIVSDGTTEIEAIFEQDFLNKFLEKNKWALEALKGELIAAVDCQLMCDFKVAVGSPTRLYIYIPTFKLGGKQKVCGSARAIGIGGTIDSTLLKMKAFLNPQDCDNNFHSNLEVASQTSSLPTQSAKFATQISNRDSESRKEKKAIPGVQATDVLRLLEQDRRPIVQLTETNHSLTEPGQLLETANITSVAPPLSTKSNSAATNLGRDDEIENKKDADIALLPTGFFINKQEYGSNGIPGNRKSSASNVRPQRIESVTVHMHQVPRVEEIYPFQENLTYIPRSYQRIPKEQMDKLAAEESWFPSSKNHISILPGILEAQLKFHERRLASQALASHENLVQSTQDSILGQGQETAQAEDGEDGGDSHEDINISKDSHKDAEEVESPHSGIALNNDEGHQSDSGGRVSWPPSPEENLRRKQVMRETDTIDKNSDQDQLMPQAITTIENDVGIPSPNGSNKSPTEASRKRIVSSPPSAIVTENMRTSAVKIRVPIASNQEPSCSSSDEEEMALEVPNVLGDQIQRTNLPVNEHLGNSGPSLSNNARNKSIVQVEKTPSQRKRPHKELSLDIIIPGTYISPQTEPDGGDHTTSSGIFSLAPAELPLHMTETFDETHQNKHERNNARRPNSRGRQKSPKSNNDKIHQNKTEVHTYSPPKIHNLDGATPDAPPSAGRSFSMPSSPPGQNIPEQKYNGVRPAKRRKTTDPRALGFSQEEPPYRDSHEMAREIRRSVLRSQPPTKNSRLVDNSIDQHSQNLASPEDSRIVANSGEDNSRCLTSPDGSRIVNDSIVKDLPSALIYDHTSTSHNIGPPGQLTSPPMISNDFNMTNKSILPNGIQSSLGQAHQYQTEQQPASLFERYCTTYPQYNGTRRQFIQALVYLEWLGAPTRQPNKSLWDDFVRFYAHEYSDHVRTSATRMSGMQFYSQLGTFEPEFAHPKDIAGRIITPESLRAALSPESPDHDVINDMRGKYKGSARPASRQSTVPRSGETRPVMQPPRDQINIAVNDDTIVPKCSQHFKKATPDRSLETAGQSPSLPSTYLTPARQEQRRTIPWLMESPSILPEMLEAIAAPTRAPEEREEFAPRRRFFETPSQLPLPSDPDSLPRNSLPSTQKLVSSTNSSRMPNGSLSIPIKTVELATPVRKEAAQLIMSEKISPRDRRARERSSKPSLERSISPLPSQGWARALAGSNKPERVAEWLKTQEQPTRIERSTNSPSTAPTSKGKWEFGKYLARKAKESSHRPPRMTPRTSFSLKPRSSSGSTGNGSPM